MERHVATSATWPGVAAGHQLDWSRESSRRGLDLLPATPQSAARRSNALTPDSTLPRSRSRVRLKLNLMRALPAGRGEISCAAPLRDCGVTDWPFTSTSQAG